MQGWITKESSGHELTCPETRKITDFSTQRHNGATVSGDIRAARSSFASLHVWADQQSAVRKRRAGSDVIDLGMGNPSDPPHDMVIEKLAEAARDKDNHGYSNRTVF